MLQLKQHLQKFYEKIKSYDSKGRIDSFVEKSKQHYKKHPRLWQIIILIFLALLLTRCYFNNASKTRRPSTPAVIAQAKTENVPVYFDALGTVTPFYTVTVKTQINGNLWQVYFREGQIVKQGDLLALIDPRPYEAQLTQYKGQYARDTALLANAELDLKRYKTLWSQNSISKQIYDTQVSLVQQDQGTVQLDLGLIQSTQVNLIYCNITSPINGQIGLRLVDPGNFVQTSDTTGIAIVNMVNPITVVFTLPEDDVPQILTQTNAKRTLTVYAYDRLENHLLATGTLLTMDNQVDPTTGTVKLKAIFANNPNTLFPNQFVNVRLLVTTLTNATVVPTEAIQHNMQGGNFVYSVNSDNTVSIKTVVPGITTDGSTVITSGVIPNESVVIEGADKLTDGASIQVADSENVTHKKKLSQKKSWRYFI